MSIKPVGYIALLIDFVLLWDRATTTEFILKGHCAEAELGRNPRNQAGINQRQTPYLGG